MTSEARPLRDDERRMLARMASPRATNLSDALSAAVMFMLAFAAGAWLVRWTLGPQNEQALAWVAAAAATLALGVTFHMRRTSGRVLARERDGFARDLAAGTVVRTTYDVTDALRVEEYEDEGSAYYLKLADGRVLFLQGQYLYDYEEREDDDGRRVPATFPCARFTLERTAASGFVLGLSDFGAPLAPSSTLPHFTHAEHRAGAVPHDGDVLAVDFETLRQR